MFLLQRRSEYVDALSTQPNVLRRRSEYGDSSQFVRLSHYFAVIYHAFTLLVMAKIIKRTAFIVFGNGAYFVTLGLCVKRLTH
jgi:hypothetical protein